APGAGGVELAGLTSLVAGRPAGQAQHWSSNRCSTNILNGPLSGGRSVGVADNALRNLISKTLKVGRGKNLINKSKR
ncbi:MAG: hypothetical protein NTY59_15735, partial [Alphaproteobacteria bacterium]|nr:hypothetical protein [Alphaproteobacteria bacterium]